MSFFLLERSSPLHVCVAMPGLSAGQLSRIGSAQIRSSQLTTIGRVGPPITTGTVTFHFPSSDPLLGLLCLVAPLLYFVSWAIIRRWAARHVFTHDQMFEKARSEPTTNVIGGSIGEIRCVIAPPSLSKWRLERLVTVWSYLPHPGRERHATFKRVDV